MKITPLEIRQHEFEKTFRGYNIEEVDNFLANISQEWERVLNDSKMLRMQLEIAEKEANKLREIEMTLFKTLKTAEDTSNMITEQANQQADKNIQESRLRGEQIVTDAQQKALSIIRQAEDKAKYIKEEVLGEVKVLERDFKAMDHYKTNLLVQMRSLANASLDHVQRFEQKFDKEGVESKFSEATSLLENDIVVIPTVEEKAEELAEIEAPAVEALAEEVNIQEEIKEDVTQESAIEVSNEASEIIENVAEETSNIAEETPQKVEEIIVEPVATTNNFIEKTIVQDNSKTDDLAIIEGIGPKIAMILFDNGIFTFRDLATTPVYKIKEMLEAEGSHFAMHDPSTWVEQALLAAEGRMNELYILQEKLKGGREVEEVAEVESNIIENTTVETIENTTTVETVENTLVEKAEETSIFNETPLEVESIITKQIEEKKDIFAKDEEAKRLDSIFEKVVNSPDAPKPSTDNNVEAITEEMLEKVNKVKLAIRKAMVEKSESNAKDSTPLPTVNDVIGKTNEGGSFFDNI